MSKESAYNKKLAQETTMDQVEGLLEHFNLPPKTIAFVRENKRTIQAGIAIVVIVVVTWSLYSSHQEKNRERAATAFSLAMQEEGTAQSASLQKIIEGYPKTSSALWARIELAHLDMKSEAYSEAITKYSNILEKVSTSDPLYPLLVYGLAQAMESSKDFDKAAGQYELLKDIKGYEHIGYTGLSRLAEAQGNIDRAIAIYNNFLLQVGDDTAMVQVKEQVSEKIARLKAQQ